VIRLLRAVTAAAHDVGWEVLLVTGVELILVALATGARAGTTDAAKGAVMDAYTGLRDPLRSRVVGQDRAERAHVGDMTINAPDDKAAVGTFNAPSPATQPRRIFNRMASSRRPVL
jgi:hypothetical protein